MVSLLSKSDKNSKFIERLIELRESMNFKSKSEFAEWLGVTRSTYSMIENGYRPPSENFLEKLFLKTGKPEEYWLYGIDEENKYVEAREEFKMLKRAISDALELNLIDMEGEYTSEENEKIGKSLFDYALAADIKHILSKKKQGK